MVKELKKAADIYIKLFDIQKLGDKLSKYNLLLISSRKLMLNNKRLFPRIKVNFKVGFEFVKWDETGLDHCRNSYEASIIDISAKGASLSELPDIDKGILKKLSTGKNKIRLNFSLYTDHDPINTFARLVWHQQPDEEGLEKQQYGFEFIDIPGTAFERIKKFVSSAGN